MTRCVLLLRGLNVGKANRIRMPDLVVLVEQAGGEAVSTYVQSGNVLADADDPVALAARLERALADVGISSPVLVRSRADLDDVIASDPFAGRDLDPKLVHVAFLSGPPDAAAVAAVDHAALLPEELVVRGRELYLWYAEGVQRSRLDRVTRGFGVVATARNWRTVNALRDLLAGASG
ncbi:MAG: hypothetical protein JWM64_1583 [Frankiales bacterium]|nr:hypothetical protein [Frankiales bacterium]